MSKIISKDKPDCFWNQEDSGGWCRNYGCYCNEHVHVFSCCDKKKAYVIKHKYVCPVSNLCPYQYDACTDPTKFCRIIEDTPEHYSKNIRGLKRNET